MPDLPRLAPARLPPGRPAPIIHEQKPENLEYPLTAQNGWLTPNSRFFLRNHFEYPAPDPIWRLQVGARSLTLADLQAMARTSQWTTLECSGNKRAYFDPPVKGEPWRDGAIGNAEWGGVPLTHLLRMAGPLDGVVEVLFTGADRGKHKETGEQVHFARSLPLADALRPDLLVACTMNGEPLPHKHGGPARLILPGWYGMAAVKWLTRIELLKEPFKGPFQSVDYVYIPQGVPVTEQKVDSTITQPEDGARLLAGPVTIRGAAWGGAQPIGQVQVSLDGGGSWQEAELVGPEQPNSWRLWQLVTPPLRQGRYRLMARAVDAVGETQPLKAEWNEKGYGNNQMPLVRFTVWPTALA